MARTNTRWIEFAGVRSSTLGIAVRTLPEIKAAEERGDSVDVLGRDGSLWIGDSSYKQMELKAVFEVPATSIQTAASWLSGYGDLVLSSFSTQFYEARIVKALDIRKGNFLDGDYQVTATFICQPFRYNVNQASDRKTLTVPGSGESVFKGSGSTFSRPTITVNGSGNINLMVNDVTFLLDAIQTSITIDCVAMMAYDANGNNACSKVTIQGYTDEWATLSHTPAAADYNTIDWSGTVSSVVIDPWWRWR